MHTLRVNLATRTYPIIVGQDILRLAGTSIRRLHIGLDAYVITNAPIKRAYGNALEHALTKAGLRLKFKIIPDSEKSKSLSIASSLIKDLAAYDRQKRVFVAAFGGGVIGDVSGFVASIYKRGIPYVQIPTTLLAQVDSSIGGKTAIDLPEAKNLVGAFYQPRLVFSDVTLLKSLSVRQLRAGLAEVIKYGIIKDAKLFSYMERNYPDILHANTAMLQNIVRCSAGIKARIVSLDEREEGGLRTILNFGHTVGHAIEAAAGYQKYNHGEAVALGMLVAVDISRGLGLIGANVAQRIENLVNKAGLPTMIKGIALGKIINAHYRDKKFIGKKNKFVLIAGIGKTKIVENIPHSVIARAIKGRLA